MLKSGQGKDMYTHCIAMMMCLHYSKVLSKKPCDVYLSLACNQFVEKFLPTLKLEREAIPLYPCHVAMLIRA